jgi:putative FmdB family regulatory protein
MPLYEYECDACHHRFEIIQKWSDPPKETCPSCGGPVHKMQSAPAFQFKGTGWYVTDYGRKDQAGSAKSGGESSSDAKPSAESSDKSGKTDKTDKTDKSGKGSDGGKSSGSGDSASGASSPAVPSKSA